MTKQQFLGLRKQGYSLKFVTYGEDIKAKMASYGDATYCSDKSYSSKVIKVKLVDYCEDVKLSTGPSYSADFKMA